MDRRSFVLGLGALGIYPIGVRAFGTKPQVKSPTVTQKGKSPEQSGKASVQSAIYFECIVGDFEMTSNGHLYTKEVWDKMFNSDRTRGPLVLWDGESHVVNLERIAGKVTALQYTPDYKVKAQLRLMDTPSGNVTRALMATGSPLFLTPVGQASHIGPDGIVPIDYAFAYFNLSNSSAFESATPLMPCDSLDIPSGYPPSMVLRAE